MKDIIKTGDKGRYESACLFSNCFPERTWEKAEVIGINIRMEEC